MVLLDKMILTRRFLEFVEEVIAIHNKEKEDETAWEYYIHRVFDMSFQDFLNTLPNPAPVGHVPSDAELAATVSSSAEMLNGFHPCRTCQ